MSELIHYGLINSRDSSNVFISAGMDKVVATMPDDTMRGEIEIGSLVAINIERSHLMADGIYAFYSDGIFMIKRLQFIGNSIQVIPTSKFYMAWEIEPAIENKLQIIGRVIASQEIKVH